MSSFGNKSIESIKYQVYGVRNNGKMKWNISSNIDVDKAYWSGNRYKELFVVLPAFSVGNAMSLKACLEKSTVKKYHKVLPLGLFTKHRSRSKQNNANDHEALDLENRLKNCNQDNKKALTYDVVQTGDMAFEDYLIEYEKWKHYFSDSFRGKLLLLNEAFFFLSQREDITKKELATIFQTGYLLKELIFESGVEAPSYKKGITEAIRCNRCGSTEQIAIQDCGICNEGCATCENCIALGRSKTCTPLYRFPNQTRIEQKKDATFSPVSLSKYQQDIADHAVSFLKSVNQRELLIWAVTGAGKTEMIFPAIARALEMGGRVLLTSPRKDVIRELAPRFKKAFPNTPVVSLYGGSEERWNSGDIYLATTHQLIRFAESFDLVIIDEMDAYPFHNNRMLQHLVERSIKGQGKLIYMTATPSAKEQKRWKRNELDAAILPVRYHLKPLPVPILDIMDKQEKILNHRKSFKLIDRFIEEVTLANGQGLIFLPTVKDVQLWVKALKRWFPDEGIKGVFANNSQRDYLIEAFRKADIKFLVTTTILERGVTVPNVHVLVLKADSNIFDEATLVQVAGRVGRSGDYPKGIVWFIGESMTNSMVRAKKHVLRMNKLSEKVLKGEGMK